MTPIHRSIYICRTAGPFAPKSSASPTPSATPARAFLSANSKIASAKSSSDNYVHLNPVRARLLRPEAVLRSYRWSSYGEYLRRASQRPAWLRVDRLLGEHGIPKDSAAGRRVFEQRMEERQRQQGGPEVWSPVRRGWCLGEVAFRKELLAQVSEQRGAHHYGAELQEGEEDKAERLLRVELARRRWLEQELWQKPKTDGQKARIARRLRQETTMTL